MKAKILNICIPVMLGLLLLLPGTGCKDFGKPEYKLEIEFEEGVNGTPTPGTSTHDEFEEIAYEYTPVDGDSPVVVAIGGLHFSPEGSFVMYTDMKAVVKIFDIRGTWYFKLDVSSGDDIETYITFTGDNLTAGSFTDDRGHSGTWELNPANDTLLIHYGDWLDYALGGNFYNMKGDWAGEGNTGTWVAYISQ